MQGSERYETFKPVNNFVGDDNWLAIVRSAMHDAVADRRRQTSADLLAQEGYDFVESRRYVAHFRLGPSLLDKGLSIDVGQKLGRVPTPSICP